MTDRPGHVYFVADSDAIKIGFTTKPVERLTALAREFPRVGPMWMIGSFEGTMQDEHRACIIGSIICRSKASGFTRRPISSATSTGCTIRAV